MAEHEPVNHVEVEVGSGISDAKGRLGKVRIEKTINKTVIVSYVHPDGVTEELSGGLSDEQVATIRAVLGTPE